MRTIQIKVMLFSELSEEARKVALGVVQEKYSDDSMDATYEQAASNTERYAKELGLTGLNLKVGEFCMNFDIDGEKSDARTASIRALAKNYHDFVIDDKEFMETNDWGQMFANVNGMVFDSKGHDATHLLSEHIIYNVITY